uniref:F-box/LRR-repeat protein 6-like n=1 Tax=Pogona vitticeps TaxID=103695 RepID=A0ABM5GDG8_9SAUR
MFAGDGARLGSAGRLLPRPRSRQSRRRCSAGGGGSDGPPGCFGVGGCADTAGPVGDRGRTAEQAEFPRDIPRRGRAVDTKPAPQPGLGSPAGGGCGGGGGRTGCPPRRRKGPASFRGAALLTRAAEATGDGAPGPAGGLFGAPSASSSARTACFQGRDGFCDWCPSNPAVAFQGGGCPELELLEVNTEIKQSSQPFQLPIEQLQAACPQLQVLRLLNVTCYVKPAAGSAPPPPGFPQLEELCLATTAFSFVDNNMLERILCASSRLRVLDLRGCFRVTPKGLELLPCSDLEQLYLGLYGSISHLRLPLEGSPLITWKWDHSLRELDLAGQSFSEQDLDRAMAAFARQERAGGEPALHSLNLTGTKITLRTVSTLIASCPSLNYLNLSSCRHLPRGMKKVYRGSDEIRQCLHQLLTSVEESGGLGEIT